MGVPIVTISGIRTNPKIDLAHEMFHAWDADRGLMDDRMYLGISRNEWQAVYNENVLRQELGEPLRAYYRRMVTTDGETVGGAPPYMLTKEGKPIKPEWYEE